MSGVVRFAAPGQIGLDVTQRVSAASVQANALKGYAFYIRYVSRTDESRSANAQRGTPDLAADETEDILAAGLAVMAVQHVARAPWRPTAALGAQYGLNAASFASAGGLPAGVNLWLDLEGVAGDVAASDVVAYCNAWFAAVATGGFVPGLYVGADCGLTSEQLFLDLRVGHYWKSGSNVPDVAHRSYQLIQYIRNYGQPTEFDQDVTQNDLLGGAVAWLSPR